MTINLKEHYAPMLAAAIKDESVFEKLTFPLFASVKLDGIRCITTNHGLLSRNLKPIPNKQIQEKFKGLPHHLDGELYVHGMEFSEISSIVMSRGADASRMQYHIFDLMYPPKAEFTVRLGTIPHFVCDTESEGVFIVTQQLIPSVKALLRFEQKALRNGFEGIILRSPDGEYKHGRSTLKEQGLMKFKRFCDAEAEVLYAVEQMKNTNVAKKDELGRTKRSSAKAGKVPMDTLGALHVVDLKTGVEFDIGSGFSAVERKRLWKQRDTLPGHIVTYRYQPVGVKSAPRFPTFLHFRDERDM